MSKKLVAYFSASGKTKKVAEMVAQAANAELFEIKPVIPYTKADLNWLNRKSRSSIEMADKTSRPEIAATVVNAEEYDVVYLGFPIWWYVAPTIVNTFLEAAGFKNAKIILFATSGGSKFGETAEYLRPSVDPSCEIIEGELLNRAKQANADGFVSAIEEQL